MSDQEVRQTIEAALKRFASQPLAEAASHLLGVLGYTSKKRLPLKPNTLANFLATFSQGRPLNDRYALPAEWKTVDFLFQLTDDEVRAAGNQQFDFESKGAYNGAVINSYLFFAIELKGNEYSRSALAGITREVNKLFNMPALILFRYGEVLTLAVINRRLHKREEGKDVLEKVTLIQDIRCANTHRAHIEILFDLSIGALHDKHGFTNFVELHAAWQKTLDTSALNKRFFQDLANWYFWALSQARFPKHAPKDADGNDALSLIRLITRVIFCWFLKEKGLLPDALFDPRKIPALVNDVSPKESTYYKAILQNLFFATLNQEMDKREFRKDGQNSMAHNLYRYRSLLKNPGETLKLLAGIPFMNGGLFECLDKTIGTKEKPSYVCIDGFSDRDDNLLKIPNDLFFGPERVVDLSGAYGDNKFKSAKVAGLIIIFNRYKFTVAENTPIEEEVALDPELLGKVFENLLATYNPETGADARKASGSFYTPRVLVDYMVDEALLAYLSTRLQVSFAQLKKDLPALESRLRHLLEWQSEGHRLTSTEAECAINAIHALKAIDIACGSGAFPMGLLLKLVCVLGKLDPGNSQWKQVQLSSISDDTVRAEVSRVFVGNLPNYSRKLFLIENCLYGVDIQPIAVQIAKLRFFISLIVDQEVDDAKPNRGVLALPNLETKIVTANSLFSLGRGQLQLRSEEVRCLETQLMKVRHSYFTAKSSGEKTRLRGLDREVSSELAIAMLKDGGCTNADAKELAAWNPYDGGRAASFFEPTWMFGMVDGFDISIGNPPFVRQEDIKEYKPTLKSQYQCFDGKADLYVYFYERSLQLLRSQGIISFISSNKFCRSEYGKHLRNYIKRTCDIRSILDFDDAKVFTAVAYPCVVIAEKSTLPLMADDNPNSRLDSQIKAYKWIPTEPISDFPTVFRNRADTLPQSSLEEDGWRIMRSGQRQLWKKLHSQGQTLERYLDKRIYWGIKTGDNKAFVVDSLVKDSLIRNDSSAKKILKPLARGRDVKKWKTKDVGLWLVFTHHGTEIAQYPSIRQHLAKFRKQLEPKPRDWPTNKPWEGRKAGGYQWYEIQDNVAYWRSFELPKVIVPTFINSPQAAVDRQGLFSNDKTTICVDEEPEVLAGILNTRVLWWVLTWKAPTRQNEYWEVKPTYLKGLPIPHLSKKHMARIKCLVEQIIEDVDNSIQGGRDAEREIDAIVEDAFGLTPAERDILNLDFNPI